MGSGDTNTAHYHTDHLGTTRNMTDAGGSAIETFAYTAFGEQIAGTNHRFGYAGAWGYQTDESGDFPYLHVGARYYDPSSGRFLQRDPIGIMGGKNAYAYTSSLPTHLVDPTGEVKIFGFEFNREWIDNLLPDLGRGSAGAIDGFIPWIDPLEDWFGFYDSETDRGTKWSKRGGQGQRTLSALYSKDLH